MVDAAAPTICRWSRFLMGGRGFLPHFNEEPYGNRGESDQSENCENHYPPPGSRFLRWGFSFDPFFPRFLSLGVLPVIVAQWTAEARVQFLCLSGIHDGLA